ncbi:cell division regulator GpsB [Weissella diestrammenae]|uniref:Cell division regulator GpsB n=2 Tax=Weissella diestrammenae TaxID=1162633 RepID=A0A7G9T7Q2_9LACO|nr:cell division regulator GpsB [Weissella diestrammenae]QNN76127.1 cell division regulator GpsB [Weissella diestrammenae]
MEKVRHTVEDIFNKDFKKTAIQGYNPKDVDSYLDELMADYQTYENNIQELETTIEKQKLEIAELTKRANANVNHSTASVIAPAANSNMDILKRLSNLERRVFGTPAEVAQNQSGNEAQ